MMVLLARTESGWVPPPQPDDGADAGADDGADAQPDVTADTEPGVTDDARVEVESGRNTPGVESPPVRAAPSDDTRGTRRALPARSWDAPADSPARRLADLLPASVRTGRFDPGRRGAVGLVVVALLAAVVAAGVVLRGQPQEVVVPTVVMGSGTPLAGVSPPPAPEVVVAVAGKVRRPGLVRLPMGSRVDDALRAAGGPEPGTPLDQLNLARKLVDGEQVLVGVDAPPGAVAAPGGTPSRGGLLDLNAASVSDLDSLPGIGPVLAQRIVDWRTENNRFGSVDQLREVTGIGEAKFADLKAKVTV